MAAVEVLIFEKGIEVGRVTRPLRSLDGQPAVKYRRRLWPLMDGNKVLIDGCVPVCHTKKIVEPVAETEAEAGTEIETDTDVVEDEASSEDEINWDEEQLNIIKAEPSKRILVSAGPGTGKTAIACARVAELINEHDLTPSRVWVISFTRTAVREIADRIAAHLDDPGSAFSIKIATLDSRAWAIHSGFDEEATLLGDYEQNIERVLELIEQNADAQEHLEQIEHLIVDEAQDVVGVRADLVLGIISKLSPQCGVTVFTDEAQAIYGFANDEDVAAEGSRGPNLVEKLRQTYGERIATMELVKVHRTHSPQLLEIFTETRRLLLSADTNGAEKLASVTDDVRRLSHGELEDVMKQDLADRDNLFVLFRRRSDVLMASSYLEKMPHRIRMSGMPVCLEPWIGAVFSDYLDPDIDLAKFRSLWDLRVTPRGLASKTSEEAWSQLTRLAGRTQSVVDVRRLRRQLSRARPAPELCSPELGEHGPIIGTIHASKGRETDIVHLMLPGAPGETMDLDEEARVIFVAATRGRKQLKVGRGRYQRGVTRLQSSGRVYKLSGTQNAPKAQVEIGRDGDIQAEGVTGRRYYKDAGEAQRAQELLKTLHRKITPAEAISDRSAEFAFRVIAEGSKRCVAVMSNSVNGDLFKVGNAIQEKHRGPRRRPPDYIQHLRIIGLRTIVLPPDSPESERLHSPWNATGIMLAPVILGFPTFPLLAMNMKWKSRA